LECATILFQFFFDFSLKHLNARLAFYNLFERLPFAVKTETDTKKEYKLVPRTRGRNKRKHQKTSELPHLFHFQRHTPTSTAFVKTALFSLGGLLDWAREKGESGQNRTP
jgi:hypothetical protein